MSLIWWYDGFVLPKGGRHLHFSLTLGSRGRHHGFRRQKKYFDVGNVEHTRYLFTKRGHLVNYGAKMIQVYGPKLWNTLPKNVHDSTSLASFKINVKNHFIEQYEDPINVNISHNRINQNNNHRNDNRNNRRRNHNSGSNHRSRLDNNTMINRPFVSRWDL